MFREDLLEKSKRIKLNILKKIYLNNGKVLKRDLCNSFNISFPTLKTYLKRIEFLLKNNNYDKIQISCTKYYVLLKCDNHLDLDELTSVLIKESLKYKLLKYLFDKDLLALSGIKICNELNISKSTLNRNIIECNKMLKEFNIYIKNFKLYGSQIQITYFFYLLFMNTGVVLNGENIMLNRLLKVLGEKFNIYLNLKQKYLLSVLIFIINKKGASFKKEYTLDDFHKKNLEKLNFNNFYCELCNFFEKIYFNKDLGKFIAYITVCFLLSFNILQINFIDKSNELKSIESYRVYNLIIYEINRFYIYQTDINDILKENILSSCYKNYFFKGIFYSNDYITLKYYLEEFSSYSRVKFVKNLMLKVYRLNIFSYVNYEYFKILILLILNNINGKTKNQISIGVVSYKEDLVLVCKIKNLINFLRKKFDVYIEMYNENKKYDLVISGINKKFESLSNNYERIYFFTNLDGIYDLNNISELLKEIDNINN